MLFEKLNLIQANRYKFCRILIFKNEVLNSNTFVYSEDDNSNCIVIDPGFSSNEILKYFINSGITVNSVFCTHGHFDHIAGAYLFQNYYNCNVYMHLNDIKTMNKNKFLLKVLNINQTLINPIVTNLIEDNIGYKIEVVHTPGHTPGSCFIKIGNVIFTGDTLYKNGIGLSNLPGENAFLLRKSIISAWRLMIKENYIFPGHGSYSNGYEIRKKNLNLRKFLKNVDKKS